MAMPLYCRAGAERPCSKAIEAGDRLTGISIMQMEAGLDTGPVYWNRHKLSPNVQAGQLRGRLSADRK